MATAYDGPAAGRARARRLRVPPSRRPDRRGADRKSDATSVIAPATRSAPLNRGRVTPLARTLTGDGGLVLHRRLDAAPGAPRVRGRALRPARAAHAGEALA